MARLTNAEKAKVKAVVATGVDYYIMNCRKRTPMSIELIEDLVSSGQEISLVKETIYGNVVTCFEKKGSWIYTY